jgi:methionine--tRNA ligase beta chain
MEENTQINYEDFKKVEIKVGEILEVEEIPASEKLLKLKVSFGDDERQILSGIKNYYEDPQVLVGKKVPFVTNLEPRKMMGLESQGMILAVHDEENFSLLEVDSKIKTGTQVS